MKALTLIIAILIAATTVDAQIKQSTGHFLVEFDKVSPPTKDIISHLEGSNAQNFMAPDINGSQQALHHYKGQPILLVFWDLEAASSTELISLLNKYQTQHQDVKVLAFCNQATSKAKEFVKDLGVKYPVLGHGAFIGEAHYYPTLGNPRMFMIGRDAIIKQVIPGEMLQDLANAKNYLDELTTKAYSNK